MLRSLTNRDELPYLQARCDEVASGTTITADPITLSRHDLNLLVDTALVYLSITTSVNLADYDNGRAMLSRVLREPTDTAHFYELARFAAAAVPGDISLDSLSEPVRNLVQFYRRKEQGQ